MRNGRVLAIRGHEPVIYEASDRLGGALYEAGVPSFKDDDRALIAWYAHTLEKLGVEIHFNHRLTAGELKTAFLRYAHRCHRREGEDVLARR